MTSHWLDYVLILVGLVFNVGVCLWPMDGDGE